MDYTVHFKINKKIKETNDSFKIEFFPTRKIIRLVAWRVLLRLADRLKSRDSTGWEGHAALPSEKSSSLHRKFKKKKFLPSSILLFFCFAYAAERVKIKRNIYIGLYIAWAISILPPRKIYFSYLLILYAWE